MASMTIVSGSPGAGKSTLSGRLSKDSATGLWIPSDLFYSFPAYPIDPTSTEANGQNEAIIRALGASASSFASSGYDVILDGIVGPWFLPALVSEFKYPVPIHYILLTVNVEVAVSRVRQREGPDESARVQVTNRLSRPATADTEGRTLLRRKPRFWPFRLPPTPRPVPAGPSPIRSIPSRESSHPTRHPGHRMA